MIALIDYGVGNLFSLRSSFAALGQDVTVTREAEDLRKADRLILPGVGAFADAAAKLRETRLESVIREEAEKGKPLLGICLGMQMLFDKSFEYGEHKGLGLISGEIRPIAGVIPKGLKIPQIGWNALKWKNPSPIFRDVKEGDHVYFVHSYAAFACDPYVTATTEYGAELCAAVGKGNIFGCQFHPEKSGKVGLSILKAFCEYEPF